jgi:hypothetical protein
VTAEETKAEGAHLVRFPSPNNPVALSRYSAFTLNIRRNALASVQSGHGRTQSLRDLSWTSLGCVASEVRSVDLRATALSTPSSKQRALDNQAKPCAYKLSIHSSGRSTTVLSNRLITPAILGFTYDVLLSTDDSTSTPFFPTGKAYRLPLVSSPRQIPGARPKVSSIERSTWP